MKSKAVPVIEALVVAAIILMVAVVIFTNVDHYFYRGKDASIQRSLNTALTNSAIHFERNGSYTTFCLTSAYANAQASILRVNGGISGTDTRCVTTATTICMCGSLKLAEGRTFCVDSTGYKNETADTCTTACSDAGKCVEAI